MPSQEKIRLYELCRFLIQRRIDTPGSNNPLEFSLHDFAVIFPNPSDHGYDNVEELRCHLKNLAGTSQDQDRYFFNVMNPEILLSAESFASAFAANGKISLSYLSVDLENYVNYLHNRDRVIENPDFAKLVFDPEKNQFCYKGKKMVVRARSGDFPSISLNLCRYMFGYDLRDIGEDVDSARTCNITEEFGYENYQPGNDVELELVVNKVVARGDEVRMSRINGSGDRFLKIRTAIRDLNARALNELGLVKVFDIPRDGAIRVVLPPPV